MQREQARVIQRLRALFFECGVRLPGRRSSPPRVPLKRLTAPGAKVVARAYLQQLDVTRTLVRDARSALIMLAQQRPAFALLQSVPYVGEVRAAELLAIVDDPSRFRSLRAVWAYGGLGVVQRLSSEHRVKNGRAVREERVARGASTAGATTAQEGVTRYRVTRINWPRSFSQHLRRTSRAREDAGHCADRTCAKGCSGHLGCVAYRHPFRRGVANGAINLSGRASGSS